MKLRELKGIERNLRREFEGNQNKNEEEEELKGIFGS